MGRRAAMVACRVLTVLAVALLTGQASAQETNASTSDSASELGAYPHHKEIWAQILHHKDPLRYDKSDPPNWGKVAVNVNVSVYLNNLLNVKEKEGSYSMDMFYRLLWDDNRLKYDPATFGGLKSIVLSSV